MILQRIYKAELKQLAKSAKERPSWGQALVKLAFGGRVWTEVTVDQFKDAQPPRLLLRELWVRFDFKELLRVTLAVRRNEEYPFEGVDLT